MAQKINTLTAEIERLQKVKNLGESIARLPSACLENMNTADEVQEAKDSALHQALEAMRGNDYDKMVSEIEDIQAKSKRAYVRLYEKVGEDIGLNFLEKLDYLGNKESEADKLINSSHKYSSAQVELQRLRDEKMRIAKMQREKEKEFLGRDQGDDGVKTNIGDLFRKYNI